MKVSVITNIVNGRFERNRKRVLELIKSFEGLNVEITFERSRKKRSNNQNAYYFGVVIPLIQEAIKEEWIEFWDKEKVHELLKSKFLFTERVDEESAEILKIPKSTTECTTVEMEEYLLQCRTFAQEWFSLTIPEPNEQLTITN